MRHATLVLLGIQVAFGLLLPALQPSSPPTISLAVQKLAVADMGRCYDELCDLEGYGANGLSGRLEEAAEKFHSFVTARQPIMQWAAQQWLRHHVAPHLPVDIAPSEPAPLSLRSALAPMQPWSITAKAFKTDPRKTVALAWRFVVLWMGRRVPMLKQRRHRCTLAPTLLELASAYSALR